MQRGNLINYYLKDGNTNGLIFVVDSNDRERIPEARQVFENTVKTIGAIKIPILVYANK